ncbi:MAG: PleD family two-component system response regulator [Paracoccaceae bacterium]
MTGRILVVDDVATNRLVLKSKLASAYYDVLLAENGTEGLQIAAATLPDLILLDVMMPDIDGYTVCRTLKGDPLTEHIPVVIVTAIGSTEERIKGLEAGADDFLGKPINDVALFARVRNLMRVKMLVDELRMRDETNRELGYYDLSRAAGGDFPDDDLHEPEILLVPGSDQQGANWQRYLRELLRASVDVAGNEPEAMRKAFDTAPDVVLVSQRLPGGGDGLRLVSRLRARPETRQSAIILVLQAHDTGAAAKALDMGASDYLASPHEGLEMLARVRLQLRRKRYSDRLRSNLRDTLWLASVDPLTGLFNRRYAKRHMAQVIERARLSGAGFAVMMLDLDRFKEVNDQYGHGAGDAVLKEFARRLQENVRGVDLVARMGGEEFFVAMPDISRDKANAAAERIRDAVEAMPFTLGADRGATPVTVSVGVAMAQPGESDIAAIMRRADEALYVSKRNGRNRITFWAEAA